MGLDLLEIPEVGILVEALFRRCSFANYNDSTVFDRVLSPKPAKAAQIYARGLVGFCRSTKSHLKNKKSNLVTTGKSDTDNRSTGEDIADQSTEAASDQRSEARPWDIDTSQILDMGNCSKDTFEALLAEFNASLSLATPVMSLWYSDIKDSPITKHKSLKYHQEEYLAYCATHSLEPAGLLPWKLLNVVTHEIEKDEGYLERWLPKINEVCEIIQKCVEDPAYLEQYMNSCIDDAFDD